MHFVTVRHLPAMRPWAPPRPTDTWPHRSVTSPSSCPAPTPTDEQNRNPEPVHLAMTTERAVRLVLDASLLLDPVGGGGAGEVAPALRPGAEALLRRLRYSNLGVVWARLLYRSSDLRSSVRISTLPCFLSEVVAWCYVIVS